MICHILTELYMYSLSVRNKLPCIRFKSDLSNVTQLSDCWDPLLWGLMDFMYVGGDCHMVHNVLKSRVLKNWARAPREHDIKTAGSTLIRKTFWLGTRNYLEFLTQYALALQNGWNNSSKNPITIFRNMLPGYQELLLLWQVVFHTGFISYHG